MVGPCYSQGNISNVKYASNASNPAEPLLLWTYGTSGRLRLVESTMLLHAASSSLKTAGSFTRQTRLPSIILSRASLSKSGPTPRALATVANVTPVDLDYAEYIPEDGNRTKRPLVIMHGLL